MPPSTIQHEIERIALEGIAPMYVQPILRADGSLHGVEALLRVPGYGPLQVLAHADRLSRLPELEFAVLTACVRIAAKRPDLGVVHINSSWKTLTEPGIATHLNALVSAAAIDPKRLSIELSEREFIAESEKAVAALKALKAVGVCFAIDDFGVGYNHLSTVTAIPIQCLKIDQSIVHAVTRGETAEQQERARRLVIGSQMLANSLDATFVIEGIEGTDERDLMVDLDCAGQGFFLGYPVPVEELILPGRLRSVA